MRSKLPAGRGDGSERRPPRDRVGTGPRPSRPPEPGDRRNEPNRPAPNRPPRPVEAAPAVRIARARRRCARRQPQQPAPAPAARPSGPATPRGSVWLHGTHAVEAALANPARRLKRLLLTEDAEAALAARVPPPWPLAAERVERARLDQLLGRDTVHQGAALLADLLAPPSLAAVLERPGPIIVLDQVTDPRNIGAVLRCAAAFGAAGVVTQDRNAPEETGAMAKAASGALERIPLLRAINLARTLAALKAAGCWVVGLGRRRGAAARREPARAPGRAGGRRRGGRVAPAHPRHVRRAGRACRCRAAWKA